MELTKEHKISIEFDMVDSIVLTEAIRTYAEILSNSTSSDDMIKLFTLHRINNKFVEWCGIIAEQEKQRQAIIKALRDEKGPKER